MLGYLVSHSRLRAFVFHVLLSLLMTAALALITFWIWFPYPYRELAGGGGIFAIVVAINMICGPLLTFIIFNPKKSRRELIGDVACIAGLQVLLLTFGAYSLWAARPVYLVFEVDRFRLVTYADIKKEDLRPEKFELHRLPYSGVSLIGTRPIKTGPEMLESLDLSLRGYDPSSRPGWWVPYEDNIETVKSRARSIAELLKMHPEKKSIIQHLALKKGLQESNLVWLPVTSYRALDWVVFLDKNTARPVSFLHVDGFL